MTSPDSTAGPPPDAMLANAGQVVQAADAEGILARLIGGVAIYSRAAERARAALGRTYGDFDLVAPAKRSRPLRAVLEGMGYIGQTVFNATHGDRRLLYHAPDDAFHIDVFLDEFEMSHKLPFLERLDLEPLTLPAADLLLTKLQVAQINAKDLSDTAMLLLDHRPAAEDGEGVLNSAYVAELSRADWGLYTTLTDNLELLGRAVETFALSDEERECVRSRAATIAVQLAEAPKTSRWRMRARVGRKVRWYETPEEIGG